jgi:hypothetical protein
MCGQMPVNHRLSAIELEDDELTPEEKEILDQRLDDFCRNRHKGTPAEQLKGEVLQRVAPR